MDWALQIGEFQIGILDIIVLVIFLSSILGCSLAGFSRSAAKTIGWILCFPVALWIAKPISEYINLNTNFGNFVSTLLAFSLCAVVSFALINILGSLVGQLLSAFHLGIIDTVLGGVWGFISALIISGLLIYILSSINAGGIPDMLDISYAYKLIMPHFTPTVESVKGALSAI